MSALPRKREKREAKGRENPFFGSCFHFEHILRTRHKTRGREKPLKLEIPLKKVGAQKRESTMWRPHDIKSKKW